MRVCIPSLQTAAAVLLVGFGDVGNAKLTAHVRHESNDLRKLHEQAQSGSSRVLPQAQQDEIVGTDSIDLTNHGGVDALRAPYNALIQSTGGLPRTNTVQRVFTGTLIDADHVLTDGDCCILEEGGKRNLHLIEVTVGAYWLQIGMNTTHWLSGWQPRGLFDPVTIRGANYFVSPIYEADDTRLDLEFCVIKLKTPVRGGGIISLRTAIQGVQTLEAGVAVKTFGWGWQSDTVEGRKQPVTQLKGLNVETTNCGELGLEDLTSRKIDNNINISVTAVWPDGAPKYLCVPAKATGSLCYQDLGAPLIGKDDRVYGVFINYFPFGKPVGLPVSGECLPPINKGNLFLNVAAPVIAIDIAMALRTL